MYQRLRPYLSGMKVWTTLIGILFALNGFGQGKLTAEFTAKGCCGMCEDRIVAALDVPGVRMAAWDRSEEKATVVYKPNKIAAERLEQLVAEVGHDTDRFTADDEAYAGLADCCKYRTGCQGCSEDEGHDHDHEDE